MLPSGMVYVGFTEKGSVVLLPDFPTSDVGRLPLVEQAVYLRLAQKANHAPTTLTVKGVVVPVPCGEWFGSRDGLACELRVDTRTLNDAIENLQAVGAIVVASVEKAKKSNGANSEPLPTQWGKKCTIGRVLGTRFKVFGWRDFRATVTERGDGAKNVPQVKRGTEALKRAPRLSAAHLEINRRALAMTANGAI